MGLANFRLNIEDNKMSSTDNIFKKSLMKIFPNHGNHGGLLRMNKLLKKFSDLINHIKQDLSANYNINQLEIDLREFLRDYILATPDKKITPYVHILCHHVPEFIETYHYLNLYSMQGLEKKNHFEKMNYFRQTNHQKNYYPTTLIEKINRMEMIH